MRKIIFLLSLLLTIFKILYCENIPIVSTPLEIKNYVNFYDTEDFAVYKLYILNPTEHTYEYYILSLSIDWMILYGKEDLDKYGIIYPNQTKEILIYLRPKKAKVQAPTFIISFRSYEKDLKYSNTIILNPRIIYEKKDRNPIVIQDFTIIPEMLKRGDAFSVIVKIYNPNPFDISVPVFLYTSYGYRKEIKAVLLPGINTIKFDSIIPSGLRVENITIGILIEDINIEKTINLQLEKPTPIIEHKKNYILISNPHDDYIYYEFELPYSKLDLIFYRLHPKPYEYVIKDGNIYAKWKIVLLPKENYIIKKTIDFSSILVILTIIILFIAFIISILQPKIEIKKEIIRLSPEDKIIRIAIYLKNKSLLPINNVIIRDRVPEIFKISKYDIAEPVGLYKEGKETILEWTYDKIKPKEELILSYTLLLPEELPKTIAIPNVTIYYNYIFGEKLETSNKISLNIIK